MKELQCSVMVEQSEKYKIDVQICSWFPRMQVNVTLSHPELFALKHIASNKLQRGDRVGYEYNINRYLEFLDDLVRDALKIAKLQVLDMQKRCNALIITLAVCSTIIYLWNPLAGIVVDLTVCAPYIYFCLFFTQQKHELENFIHTQKATFTERADKMRQLFGQSDAGGR